ncbi:unnamed protein product, partial [Meganyctiphanes norvegica]
MEGWRLEAPATYVALQDHLTVIATRKLDQPRTEAPLYTWDFDNDEPYNHTLPAEMDDQPTRPKKDKGSHLFSTLPGNSVSSGGSLNTVAESHNLVNDLDFPDDEEEDTYEEAHLTLKLYAGVSWMQEVVWKTVLKPWDVEGALHSARTFTLPCGFVVQGGPHIFRLERGTRIIAESGVMDVSWPKIVIEVPSTLETYRTPCVASFRFTGNKCNPRSTRLFKAWAELLYHGSSLPNGNKLYPTPVTPRTLVPTQPKPAANRRNMPSIILNRIRRTTRKRIHRKKSRRSLKAKYMKLKNKSSHKYDTWDIDYFGNDNKVYQKRLNKNGSMWRIDYSNHDEKLSEWDIHFTDDKMDRHKRRKITRRSER